MDPVFGIKTLSTADSRCRYWSRLVVENVAEKLGVQKDKLLAITTGDICDQSKIGPHDQADPWITKHETINGNTCIREYLFSNNYIEKVTLDLVRRQKDRYGTVTVSEELVKKKILVEYSSPNIAKPFHAGHFRSTILGNIMCNLYEACGHTVYRINYLGDWGIQYGVVSYGLKQHNREDILDRKKIKYLMEMYVNASREKEKERIMHSEEKKVTNEINDIFRRLEEGDPEELRMWKKCRDLSIEEYEDTYKRLGIRFTAIEGESMYRTHTKQLLRMLEEKGLLKFKSDTGVGYMKIEPVGLVDEAILVRSNGTSLYLTRDVAAALDRHKRYQFDLCHYVVEQGQYLHFKQLVRILKELGIEWAKRYEDSVHISFGRIGKMSTRKGDVVILQDFLDELKDTMVNQMDMTSTTKVKGEEKDRAAEILALTTVVFWDQRQKKNRDYLFDWSGLTNVGIKQGVSIQYAHARLSSLLSDHHSPDMDEGEVDMDLLTEPEAVKLITHIFMYEERVQLAMQTQEPYVIASFLVVFRGAIGGALSKLHVQGAEPNVAKARLQLFKCAKTVLANGLNLLGIPPLKRM